MRKARNIDDFLMFDATKSQVFKLKSGKSRRFRKEDEEEAKLHERENELKILQEILSKKLG